MAEERTVIMVLDRGFVIAARIIPHPEKPFWYKTLAERTIRVWGTTQGLAQLCSGPIAPGEISDGAISGTTTLDPICTGEVPWRAIIKIIDVDEHSWLPFLTHSSGR